jgi:hypothetical protein
MALPAQVTRFQPIATSIEAEPAPRIRRCTFRRLSRLSSEGAAVYAVSCLFPDRKLPLPLGDMASSLAICEACSASHTFRPDED